MVDQVIIDGNVPVYYGYNTRAGKMPAPQTKMTAPQGKIPAVDNSSIP